MAAGKLPMVVYKNDINKLDLSKLNPMELNVFFTLMSTLKNKGFQKIEISFDRLRTISKLDKNINDNDMNGLIIGTLNKIGLGNLVLENNEKWVMFAMFDRLEVDKKTKTVSYVLNNTFYTYFNKFIDQYTIIPMADFTKVKGKYAKLLYKTLMQFSNTGRYYENYEKFVTDVLQIPESTNRNNINYKYITPNVEKIKATVPAFRDLQVNYVKNGKTIVSIEFTWQPFSVKEGPKQDDPAEQQTMDDILNELAEGDKKLKTKNVDDDDMPF